VRALPPFGRGAGDAAKAPHPPLRGDLELKQAVTMAAEAGRKYINVASESLGG
jgi:hypothetical protein